MKKTIISLMMLIALISLTACDTELGHHEEHDHDGDGVQDHTTEEHDDHHDDEDEGHTAGEEHSVHE